MTTTQTKKLASGKKPSELYPVPNPKTQFDDDYKAAPDLESLATLLMKVYEAEFSLFRQFTVIFLWKAAGGSGGGKSTLGKCQKPNGLVRHFSQADFVIWLAADHLQGESNLKIEAVLHHEMRHVGINDKGNPAIVPHDWTGFNADLTEYGTYMHDFRQLRAAFEQMPLWESGPLADV